MREVTRCALALTCLIFSGAGFPDRNESVSSSEESKVTIRASFVPQTTRAPDHPRLRGGAVRVNVNETHGREDQ